MNILVVGNFYKSASGLHISETLNEMGHKTFRFEPGLKYGKESLIGMRWNSLKNSLYNDFFSKIAFIRKKKLEQFYKIINKNKIDLTLVLHDYLFPEEVEGLKKRGAVVALWFPDPLSNIKKALFLISGYDYLFFVDQYFVEELKKDFKLNSFFLPQACFPKYHQKPIMTQKDLDMYSCEIGNIGNMNVNRVALYEKLTKYDVKMWGNVPPVWINNPKITPMIQGKTVRHEDKAKAFYGANIVLNNLMFSVVNGVNKRVFEATACGAFVLMKYFPVINSLYIDGKEIVTYKNYDDMIEKIDYYLEHKEERKQIAEAGMKRAHKDHTLEIRLTEMLKIIFG